MTTQIFIENATCTNFALKDMDNHTFGQILSNQIYSLPLKYSTTFKKKYKLIFNGNSQLTFSLSVNGELQEINVNCLPYALLIQMETCHRPKVYNKLIITPSNNLFARVKRFCTYESERERRNDYRNQLGYF